ncbi:MAG TPA: hypothetical protein VFM37_10435, partial [Pseudonocardiaceae bacterium]|nr:hypothetical protein [Pseudonocardiaceae bacterium]
GTVAATCRLGWKQRAGVEVYADNLALTITETYLQVTDERGEQPPQPVDPDDAKRAVDRAFVDAVLGVGSDVRAPYSDALRTHRLACMIAGSAAKGTLIAH